MFFSVNKLNTPESKAKNIEWQSKQGYLKLRQKRVKLIQGIVRWTSILTELPQNMKKKV